MINLCVCCGHFIFLNGLNLFIYIISYFLINVKTKSIKASKLLTLSLIELYVVIGVKYPSD